MYMYTAYCAAPPIWKTGYNVAAGNPVDNRGSEQASQRKCATQKGASNCYEGGTSAERMNKEWREERKKKQKEKKAMAAACHRRAL